jgi:Terminase RNaseH-like domain/Phage terminase large subunit
VLRGEPLVKLSGEGCTGAVECRSCGARYEALNDYDPCSECRLTPKQQECNRVLAGPQRHTLGYGGSRSGKTALFVRAVVQRAIHAPGTNHLMLRLYGNSAKSSLKIQTLPAVMKLWYPQFSLKNHDGYVEVVQTGSFIWITGTDEPSRIEKILGMEFVTIYFNECSQLPYQTILLLLTRLAEKSVLIRQRAYYDLNPTSDRHYTALLFLKGLDPLTGQPARDTAERAYFWMNPKDNYANLDPAYITSLDAMPERQRKRFRDGVYQPDVEGALWTRDQLAARQFSLVFPDQPLPHMVRIVVAIDPAAKSGEDSDETGILVVGKCAQGYGYVIRDLSDRYTPNEWATKAIELYRGLRADRVVAEVNNGGDMVGNTIHSIDPTVSYEAVTATRGKAIRAQPVAALYESRTTHPFGLVFHVGELTDLEDQMAAMTVDFNKEIAGYSPDRVDALVWALTYLFVDEPVPLIVKPEHVQAARSLRRNRYARLGA